MYDKKPETVNDIYMEYIQNENPDTIIMIFNETGFSANDFKNTIDRFIRHLVKLGVRKNSFVGYTMPNCPELFALFIAISQLGGCCVPLFHMIPDIAKADIYKKTNVQIVITSANQLASFKEASIKLNNTYNIATIDHNSDGVYSLSEPSPEDININNFVLTETDKNLPLLIASSSGTTGIPKSVLMSQSNIASELLAAVQFSIPPGNSIKPDYRSVIAFPLSTAGIITLSGILFGGVCQIFSADMSPVKFMQLASFWKADCLSCPPAYFEGILTLPMIDTFELSTIKMIQTGMDFLTPSLLERLKTKFVNLNFFANGYGLIETSNVFMQCKSRINLNNPVQTGFMELSDGTANEIEVRDEDGKIVLPGNDGELYVRGKNVINGYLANPEENKTSFINGWFKTGDVVRNEGNNRITLLGRKKYLIKRGGKSVSPVVVQNHINKLPGIKNSAVTGIPHPLYGEMVWAFIVLQSETNLQLKDVMRHCRSELANYMVPDSILFMDEIPKNPGVGKVNYEKLRELAVNELLSMQGENNG